MTIVTSNVPDVNPVSPKNRPGYVYIIRADSGHYKIGRSVRPDKRVGEFTLKLPFKVEIIQIIECDNYIKTEKCLHALCQPWHVNGEWFLLPDVILSYLQSAATCGLMPDIIECNHSEYGDFLGVLPDCFDEVTK